MALSRRFLTALGIESDKQEEIINAHMETVDALKEERDAFKADAEKLPGVQKELDKIKEAAKDSGRNPFEVKYNALKEEFEAYKTEQTQKATQAAKESAYRDILKSAGVAEKRIDAVVRVTDLSKIELDENGNVKNADSIAEDVKAEWSDFIQKAQEVGAKTPTPPGNNSPDYDSMSDADYYKATYEAKKG